VSRFWWSFMSDWQKSELLLLNTLKCSFSVLQKQHWIYYLTKRQLSVLYFERFRQVLRRQEDGPAIYAAHQDKFLNMVL
jgi:hypothetical protein